MGGSNLSFFSIFCNYMRSKLYKTMVWGTLAFFRFNFTLFKVGEET